MTVASDIKPLPGRVLVKNLSFGEKKLSSGIIVMDDDGKERGIHPRWGQVWRVGEGVTEVKEGDWVLVAHGRWSRTVDVELGHEKFKVNMVDFPDGILLVSDIPMNDHYIDIAR